MSAFHVLESVRLRGATRIADRAPVLLRRLQERRAARRARREFEAVFRAFATGAPLPRRLRRTTSS